MQGLWTNHRRSRINLNSPVPTGILPDVPSDGMIPQVAPDVRTPDGPTVQATNVADEPIASAGVLAQETRPLSSVAKRKARSTKVNVQDESNKRMKHTSQSTSVSKDYAPPSTRLSDLGGVEACVEKMLELIAMPICHPEVYLHTGIQPPRGVLLHGPPGCGKTLLANAIAGVSKPLFHIRFIDEEIWATRNSVYHLSMSPRHRSSQECPESQRRLSAIYLKTRRYEK